MKIATWNVERPNGSSEMRNRNILAALGDIDADILVLSETNSVIHLGEQYHCSATHSLFDFVSKKGEQYKEGENRVTIWSKYATTREVRTYYAFSCVCVALNTPFGELNVYGNVIGAYGNREESFKTDLEMQVADWQRISELGAICIAGDFNLSFSDTYYYTKIGRQEILESFQQLGIKAPTFEIPENIDHIAISESFLGRFTCKVHTWNEDKKLSDHIGVCITLERSESRQ